MGLLTEGSPLSWEETKKYADHVRDHGITQLLAQWPKMVNLNHPEVKWGDEIEYSILKFDDENKRVYLSCRAEEILPKLQAEEIAAGDKAMSSWKPEYASYMLEGTPGKPYGGLICCYKTVEANMRLRRKQAEKFLEQGEHLVSLTVFPLLGSPHFAWPDKKPTPDSNCTRSLFYPDDVIYNTHPRFKTLSRNIRERRGKKVAIYLPIMRDTNTEQPFQETYDSICSQYDYPPEQQARCKEKCPLRPDFVYLDAMGFGMGACCLQVTFQCTDMEEARFLYDQLAPVAPIALALSASAPFVRGYLVDYDVRWSTISQSVDDRTDEELGLRPLVHDRHVIPKSRYDSIDSYLSAYGQAFNDMPLVKDEDLYARMLAQGVDEPLAAHYAHLFIRDPLVLFSEKIQQNDDVDMDHFENIQSTNWNTLRFKPPPPGSDIGIRVEFRPLEVQLSDVENAAYTCFVALLTRAILAYGLNFVIPISKVDENMKRAYKRDAYMNEKFWFRTTKCGSCHEFINRNDFYSNPDACPCYTKDCDDIQCEELTMNEIMNGKPMSCFPGLLGYINKFLEAEKTISAGTRRTVGNYLEIIRQRAAGETPTAAHWMRDFVMHHPSYAHDSRIPDDTAYDLMKEVVLYGDNNKALERFGIKSHCVEHIVACYESMVPSELGKRKSLSSIASPLEANVCAPFTFAPNDSEYDDLLMIEKKPATSAAAAAAAPAANGANGYNHHHHDAEPTKVHTHAVATDHAPPETGQGQKAASKLKNGLIVVEERESNKKTGNGAVANGQQTPKQHEQRGSAAASG